MTTRIGTRLASGRAPGAHASHQALAHRTPQRGGRHVGRVRGQGELILQPWLTLFGVAGSGDVIQAASDWLDARYTQYHLIINLIKVAGGAELLFETAIDVAGPWRHVGPVFSGNGFYPLTLTSDSTATSESFDRYHRWRVDAPAGTAWWMCFQIKALPGTAVLQGSQNPRRM
jgi:hypothetical protein